MENKILNAIEGLNQRFDAFETKVEKRFDAIDKKFDAIDKKFDAIDKKFDAIDKKFDAIDKKFDAIDKKFDAIDHRFDIIESQVGENTQILKALQHSSEVNKAEHDKMAIDLAKVQGNITGLRRDISTMEVVTANNYADLAKLKAVS